METLELDNIALTDPASRSFILLKVHTRLACRENGRPTFKPFVGISAYGTAWSLRDVERCARNERFMGNVVDARVFARSMASTLQTCTSLGALRLHAGREYLEWHVDRLVVDWYKPTFMAEYGLL